MVMDWIERGTRSGGGKERDVLVKNDFQVFSLSQELFAKRAKFGKV